MEDDQRSTPGTLHIELDPVDAVLDARLEGVEGIFQILL